MSSNNLMFGVFEHKIINMKTAYLPPNEKILQAARVRQVKTVVNSSGVLIFTNGGRITGLSTSYPPIAVSDVISYDQLNVALRYYVPIAGATMGGSINMNNFLIIYLNAKYWLGHDTYVAWVKFANDHFVSKAGNTIAEALDMVASKVTWSAVPTNVIDLANKAYIETKATAATTTATNSANAEKGKRLIRLHGVTYDAAKNENEMNFLAVSSMRSEKF